MGLKGKQDLKKFLQTKTETRAEQKNVLNKFDPWALDN